MPPVFRDSFVSATETGTGRRPVIFDVLGPDYETSLLPDGVKMVLHVNPQSMAVKYQRLVTRIQTRGGFVEQHWGDGPRNITFDAVSGGFMRLYAGLSNITSTKYGGNRRETIAYDKYLDFLALFHNNGTVYDVRGNAVFQGIIKVTFDGGVFLGWFTSFQVTEATDRPYLFSLNASFEINKEIVVWRSSLGPTQDVNSSSAAPVVGQLDLPE